MHATQPAPGKRDPEGRRRAILDAAAELIVENGPAAITHRAIAARAGVSLGSTTQYFASIDELREQALQRIADDIDRNLAEMEATIPDLLGDVEHAMVPLRDFLRDRRAVDGELALIASGTVDARMRALARRWNDRLAAMLAPHIGRARAAAITVYLDGATVHAALHDEPLSLDDLAAAVRALLAMPDASAPRSAIPRPGTGPTTASPAPATTPTDTERPLP
ncbi:TetR/AcrR family transcriptional regulator [Leucobacter ruminantium]|uniref:TetR family transcriptional regulator n=1 Tax=Leucobacter ruminantium TaxID=1289170 RepID=A0A939RXF7_9MICO|nr:TetR family transcriptional regulator [Leucobacter ruminantium]MBO1806062.1 TetR family transcriptional regulator [Leucobacter ruminantium]